MTANTVLVVPYGQEISIVRSVYQERLKQVECGSILTMRFRQVHRLVATSSLALEERHIK